MHNSAMPGTKQNALSMRQNAGIVEIPLHYMRGGTSTGVVIWQTLLPHEEHLRAELLRHLMAFRCQVTSRGSSDRRSWPWSCHQ